MKEHQNDMDESRRQTQDHGGAQPCFQRTEHPSSRLTGMATSSCTFLWDRTGIGLLEFLHVR